MRLFHGVICGISTEMFVNASIFMLIDLRCFIGISPFVNSETVGLEDWKENYIKIFIGFGINLGAEEDTSEYLRIRYH